MEKRDNLSLVLHGINDLRLEQTSLPEDPAPNEVQLSTHTVGICGSDIHFLTHGRCNAWIVKSPMICGHESSATVVGVGNNVKELKIGDRVSVEPGVPCLKCEFCSGGRYNLCRDIVMQSIPPFDGSLRRFYNHSSTFCHNQDEHEQLFQLPNASVSIFIYKSCSGSPWLGEKVVKDRLPDNVSYSEGAIIEPLAVAVYGCQKLGIRHNLHQKILVTGAGPMGLLFASVAKAYGAQDICILDTNVSRLELSRKLGINKILQISSEQNKESIVQSVTQLLTDLPDITIECTGVQSCLNIAIRVTKEGGKVGLVGLNHESVNISLSNAGFNELELIGIRRYKDNSFTDAISLVSKGKIDIKPLISHVFKLEEGIKAFDTAKTCVDGVIKVQIVCQ